MPCVLEEPNAMMRTGWPAARAVENFGSGASKRISAAGAWQRGLASAETEDKRERVRPARAVHPRYDVLRINCAPIERRPNPCRACAVLRTMLSPTESRCR